MPLFIDLGNGDRWDKREEGRGSHTFIAYIGAVPLPKLPVMIGKLWLVFAALNDLIDDFSQHG